MPHADPLTHETHGYPHPGSAHRDAYRDSLADPHAHPVSYETRYGDDDAPADLDPVIYPIGDSDPYSFVDPVAHFNSFPYAYAFFALSPPRPC